MAWTTKQYDPNKKYTKPTERLAAQREWVVTKGQIIAGVRILTIALPRSGLEKGLLTYYLEHLEGIKHYGLKAADKKWRLAQTKYPKKVRRRKTPIQVINNYWEKE